MTDNQPPTPPNNQSGEQPEQPAPQEVTAERAEQLLTEGTIAHLKDAVLWGSNYSALVHVNDGELQTTAVYKPQQGERPLWDFPSGTLCYREVASYNVSQVLRWQIVPPTVLREGPHGLGSLQLFVKHDPEINYFNLDDRFVVQLQRFALFDALVNNADRKGGHVLLTPEGQLWGIDHGLTFHFQPKLRSVIWEFAGQAIGNDLLEDITRLCGQLETIGSPIRQKLLTLISANEIEALQLRMRKILEEKIYPMPGPGPNHPWPPV